MKRLAALRDRLSKAEVSLTAAVLAAALALLARFMVAFYGLGSNDIITWAGFARSIRTSSLGALYDSVPLFNHPPLMGLMASLADAISSRFHVRFDLVFKTPVILVEWVGAIFVYRSWRTRGSRSATVAFLLFALNPTSLLISGYHGNTDAMCAVFSLMAAFFIDAGQPLAAGLALAAAINVKLIAVLLIPVLLSFTRSWKGVGRFSGALAIGALPFLPFVFGHWPGFRAHVLSYNSTPGYWGVTQLLVALRETASWQATGERLVTAYMAAGKTLVLAVSVIMATLNLWKPGRWSARDLAAIVYCLFLVVTPGFGIQYLVYPCVLLFAVNLRQAVAYGSVAGLYAAVTYLCLWTGTWPAFSDFRQVYPPVSQGLAYITWAVIAQMSVSLLNVRLRRARLPW
ncbi:MAG: hypothetical protein ABJA82_10325 [Myxococcales bacterium]